MPKTEAFTKVYRLTAGEEKLLGLFLTGHEQVISLDHAMIERVKELGEEVNMQFLAAALIEDGTIIRLYYRQGRQLFYKDVPAVTDNPSLDLFNNIAAYHYHPDEFDYKGDFYIEIPHRPN